MLRFRRCLKFFIVIFVLTACLARPAPATSTHPPPTEQPSSTSTESPTPAPTETVVPSPVPLSTAPSTPVEPVTGLPQGTNNYPWWNDAVFYEIFVRSFYDSDGDGIGDFKGLTSKLDYLNDGNPNTTNDLGVTALWLMPIHPSPSYHGYDVTDFYAVNPQYGNMEDFKNFLSEAHKRGIRVTIDWVLNHTSNQHPWFQQAQDPASPYRDWYVWSAGATANPKWTLGGGGEYYYSNFIPEMPDLNYRNPAVVEEMKKVTRFWLQDVGIDGFRLDAAKHLIEDGSLGENTPETHGFYKVLRKFYKSVNPRAVTIGEVASPSEQVQTYLTGDELDLAFDFDLAKNFVFSAATHSSKYASDVLVHDLSIFHPGQFATFLTNHDQDRAMSVLNDNVEDAKSAAMLLLTSPGVPFLYYGEEIGMLGKKPDESIRRPLQWSAEANAGFTTGQPWIAPDIDYTTKNISTQSIDANSLLSFYRTLIHLRNDHAALRVGNFYQVETGNGALFASLRMSPQESVLVIINLGSKAIGDYALQVDKTALSGEYEVVPLLYSGKVASQTIRAQSSFENFKPVPEIPAYGRFILQLKIK